MGASAAEPTPLLDIAAAAAHLGVSEVFIRRLVLEKRIRYYKVGKFVRFRPADLEAFVEAGRREPVELRVHERSPLDRRNGRRSAQQAASKAPLRPTLLRNGPDQRR